MLERYAIVPPISPWEEPYREEIEMDLACRTIGSSSGEAWRIHCQRGQGTLEPGELSRRIQYWFDLGYRVKKIRLEFIPA